VLDAAGCDPLAVEVAPAVLAHVLAHARSEAPRECCGHLVGRPHTRIVDQAVAATNIEPGTTRYVVDPADHFRLMKRLRGTDREIVGGYHSHPRSPAVPSATDVADAFSAAFLYLIVSLLEPDRPDVRAWRISGEEIRQVSIVSAQ
jgi:proteasome lid subunit RPN8/RPN11